MSTRASAPRCASCGMPLTPAAESCSVCGARVPLIARPTTGDDDAVGAGDEGTSGAAVVPAAPLASEAQPVAVLAPAAAGVPRADLGAPAPGLSAAPSARTAAFDAAAAARDVRAAARPSRGGPGGPAAVPSVGSRVLAYAIDVLVMTAAGVVGLVVARLAGTDALTLVALPGLLVAVAQVLAEGLRGATLGASLLRLRTVDARTGAAPGVLRALVRQLVVASGVVVLALGNWVIAASGAWDSGPRRRGWHDMASGTAVVAAGAASGRRDRGAGAAAAPGGGRPWTPTAPPAAPHRPAPGAPGAPGAYGDAGSAPSSAAASDVVLPPPPAVVRPPAAAPVPDLVPQAPGDAGATPATHARPEADLLPPPPDAHRRTRGGARSPRAVPPAVAPVTAPQPPDEELADLEHTRVRDPESLRRRTGTLALTFDTGERVRVVGRGLVGRGPRAEDGQDILHVVVLSDAARSLSRVHVEFGPQPATADEDPAIWVMDRGSTNGTVVVDPSGAARVLPAGARAVVAAGWSVRLGDREARVEDD